MKYVGVLGIMIKAVGSEKVIKIPKSVTVKNGKRTIKFPLEVLYHNNLSSLERIMKQRVYDMFEVAREVLPGEKKIKTCPNCGEQLELNFD